MSRDAVFFTIGAMVGLLVGAGVAMAGECPPDRPIKRTVASSTMTCTLMACVGKLTCPNNLPGSYPPLLGADCYYAPAAPCNTCKADVTEICLSPAELKAAE